MTSILASEKLPANAATKDAGIFLHDLQPLPSLKSTFRKSSTKSNCLAVTTTHVFAAQADKAVVHVYNVDRQTQEAVVPFPERISSIALVGQPDEVGILALGTEGGKLILWEVRIVLPHAHSTLQHVDDDPK